MFGDLLMLNITDGYQQLSTKMSLLFSAHLESKYKDCVVSTINTDVSCAWQCCAKHFVHRFSENIVE